MDETDAPHTPTDLTDSLLYKNCSDFNAQAVFTIYFNKTAVDLGMGMEGLLLDLHTWPRIQVDHNVSCHIYEAT